jgi:hypothetical protein
MQGGVQLLAARGQLNPRRAIRLPPALDPWPTFWEFELDNAFGL